MSSFPSSNFSEEDNNILKKNPRERDLKVTTILLNPSEKKSIKEMVEYLNPSNKNSTSRNSYSVENNMKGYEISKSFSLLPSSTDLDSSSDSGYRKSHLSDKPLSAFSGSPSRNNNDFYIPQKNQQRILNISEEDKRKIRERMVKEKIREINRKKEEKNRKKKNQYMEVRKENQYIYKDNTHSFEPLKRNNNDYDINNNENFGFSFNNYSYNYKNNSNNYNYSLTPEEKRKKEIRVIQEKMEKKRMIREYNKKMRQNNLKKGFSIITEVDNEDKTSSSESEEINKNGKDKSGRKEKKIFERFKDNKEETTEGFTVFSHKRSRFKKINNHHTIITRDYNYENDEFKNKVNKNKNLNIKVFDNGIIENNNNIIYYKDFKENEKNEQNKDNSNNKIKEKRYFENQLTIINNNEIKEIKELINKDMKCNKSKEDIKIIEDTEEKNDRNDKLNDYIIGKENSEKDKQKYNNNDIDKIEFEIIEGNDINKKNE